MADKDVFWRADGLMRRREASINDVRIAAGERRFAALSWQTDQLPLR